MRLWPWIRQPKPVQNNHDYEQYDAWSQLLERNGHWIGVADTKAGAILAFVVVAFPLFVAPALPAMQKIIKAIPYSASFWANLPLASFIALLVSFLIAAFVTLVYVLMTLIPRLARPGKPGLLFFSDIASQEYTQWQQRMLALDSQTLAFQVLEQVYATACIADRKHKYVRQAICALIVTIVLGLVLYVLSLLIS